MTTDETTPLGQVTSAASMSLALTEHYQACAVAACAARVAYNNLLAESPGVRLLPDALVEQIVMQTHAITLHKFAGCDCSAGPEVMDG